MIKEHGWNNPGLFWKRELTGLTEIRSDGINE